MQLHPLGPAVQACPGGHTPPHCGAGLWLHWMVWALALGADAINTIASSAAQRNN
jgi:hypothetical protein